MVTLGTHKRGRGDLIIQSGFYVNRKYIFGLELVAGDHQTQVTINASSTVAKRITRASSKQ